MKKLVVLLLATLGLAWATPALAWTWPVAGDVVRAYALGDDPYASGQHRGVDIGAPLEALVRAPLAGVVTFRGFVPSGGPTLTIATADGYAVTLQQLGTITLAKGDAVLEGAVVASVGASSDAVTTQTHVHLGVRVAGERHAYVDPLSLLSALPPAFTDPTPDVVAPEPPSEPEPIPENATVVEEPEAILTPTAESQPPPVAVRPQVAPQAVSPSPVVELEPDVVEAVPVVSPEPTEESAEPDPSPEPQPVSEPEPIREPRPTLERRPTVELETDAEAHAQPPAVDHALEPQPAPDSSSTFAASTTAPATQLGAVEDAVVLPVPVELLAEAAHQPIGIALAVPSPAVPALSSAPAPSDVVEPVPAQPPTPVDSDPVPARASATSPGAERIEQLESTGRRAPVRTSERGDSGAVPTYDPESRAALSAAVRGEAVLGAALEKEQSPPSLAPGVVGAASADFALEIEATRIPRAIPRLETATPESQSRPGEGSSAGSLLAGLLLVALGSLAMASVVWAWRYAGRRPALAACASQPVLGAPWRPRRSRRVRCAARGLPHTRRSDSRTRRAFDRHGVRPQGRLRERLRVPSVDG